MKFIDLNANKRMEQGNGPARRLRQKGLVPAVIYGPGKERFAHLSDVSFTLGIPRLILTAVIVVFGLFPSLMFDMIQTASIPLINGLP